MPEELYILELRVGNGSQARTWLNEFVQLDRRHPFGRCAAVGLSEQPR